MNWLRNSFILLMLAAIVQTIIYYPQMPSVMASHFDGAGIPDGWSSRTAFFALYLVILALLAVVFLYTPKWAEKHPRLGMRLPNKDYWLAPERAEESLGFIKRQVLIMGNVHMLLALFSVELVIRANLTANPILDTRVFWALMAYFVFLAIWLVYFFLHFRKPV